MKNQDTDFLGLGPEGVELGGRQFVAVGVIPLP